MGSQYYRRQSVIVAGTAPTLSPFMLSATLPLGLLGTANSRLFCAICVYGPDHGKNQATYGAKNFQPLPHDLGNDDSTGGFSSDIFWIDEVAGDAGVTAVQYGTTQSTGTDYVAAWFAEYTNIDQTDYSTFNTGQYGAGDGDFDGSLGGTGSGSTATCTRGGGNTYNYVPALGIWIVGTKGATTLSSVSHFNAGFVTDGTNISLGVQDNYVNATGRDSPVFNFGSSVTYYNWFSMSMKTTAFPLTGARANDLRASGFGLGSSGIRVAIR